MPPITMLIKPVSGLCNMRCKYCFYADVTENREIKSYGTMSLDTLETLVRKALDYAEGICVFAFQGGEPTLAGIDFYKKLMEFQKMYNYKKVNIFNSIQTNGYNISPEFARFLNVNKFLAGLSMDGTQAIHDELRVDAKGDGTFPAVNRTVKLFDSHKVEYNILCVVNNLIASEPDKVYNTLKKYKFVQYIPCIDNFDGIKKNYSLDSEKYANFLKKTFDRYYSDFMRGDYVSVRIFDNYIGILMGRPPENCAMNGVCSCYFLIEGDGSVFPCDFYVLDEWKLGNVNKDSFARMLNSETAHKFVEVSRHVDEKCLKCKWQKICRGGCRRDREPIIDGKPSLNKYCSAYKDFFEYAYERMEEIADKLKAK